MVAPSAASGAVMGRVTCTSSPLRSNWVCGATETPRERSPQSRAAPRAAPGALRDAAAAPAPTPAGPSKTPKARRKEPGKAPALPVLDVEPFGTRPGRSTLLGVPLPVGTERVVAPALLGIGEDLVGFVDLLETGVLPLVDVGVVLARELPVRGLDGLLVRAPVDAQNSIVVLVLNGHRLNPTRSVAGQLSVRHSSRSEKARGPRGSRGPPQLPRSAARGRGEGDVEGHLPALEQHGQPVALLHVLGEALVVGQRAHLLAIDLTDHVAALHPRLAGRAALVHARDDHAVRGLQTQLARDLGRERTHVEAERARRRAAARLLPDLLLVGRFADLDVHGFLALVAPHPHLRVVAGLGEPHRALQVR